MYKYLDGSVVQHSYYETDRKAENEASSGIWPFHQKTEELHYPTETEIYFRFPPKTEGFEIGKDIILKLEDQLQLASGYEECSKYSKIDEIGLNQDDQVFCLKASKSQLENHFEISLEKCTSSQCSTKFDPPFTFKFDVYIEVDANKITKTSDDSFTTLKKIEFSTGFGIKKISTIELIEFESKTIRSINLRNKVYKSQIFNGNHEQVVGVSPKKTFLSLKFGMDQTRKIYTEKTLYDLKNIISFLGGLVRGLTILFFVLVWPFREISFNTTLINEMFMLCDSSKTLKKLVPSQTKDSNLRTILHHQETDKVSQNDDIEARKLVNRMESLKHRYQEGGLFYRILDREKENIKASIEDEIVKASMFSQSFINRPHNFNPGQSPSNNNESKIGSENRLKFNINLQNQQKRKSQINKGYMTIGGQAPIIEETDEEGKQHNKKIKPKRPKYRSNQEIQENRESSLNELPLLKKDESAGGGEGEPDELESSDPDENEFEMSESSNTKDNVDLGSQIEILEHKKILHENKNPFLCSLKDTSSDKKIRTLETLQKKNNIKIDLKDVVEIKENEKTTEKKLQSSSVSGFGRSMLQNMTEKDNFDTYSSKKNPFSVKNDNERFQVPSLNEFEKNKNPRSEIEQIKTPIFHGIKNMESKFKTTNFAAFSGKQKLNRAIKRQKLLRNVLAFKNSLKNEKSGTKKFDFSFSFFEKIRYYFPFCQSQRIKLFKEATTLIKQKLDVRTTLHTMMELEKFKQLMFDFNQYNIFEHLPKPIIFEKNVFKKHKDKSEKEKYRLSHMEDFWRKLPQFRGNLARNEQAIENLKKKRELDVIDERLLELLGVTKI